MKKNILNLLILLNLTFTQVSIESTPKSFLSNRNFTIQEIILPDINVAVTFRYLLLSYVKPFYL